MQWDHEPTPNPSQEGNRVDVDECLFPSWEGSGAGRFMESGRTKAAADQGPARAAVRSSAQPRRSSLSDESSVSSN